MTINKTLRRVFCIALIIALTLPVCTVGMAAEEVTVSVTTATVKEAGGKVTVKLNVTNNSAGTITVNEVVAADAAAISSIASISKTQIGAGGSASITFTAAISKTLEARTYTGQTVYVGYTAEDGSTDYALSDDFAIIKTSAAETESTEEAGQSNSPRISRVDAYGNNVPAPSGDYGDTIKLRLPLTCDFNYIHDVTVTPVISGELDSFPFDITLVDYSLFYGGSISAGNVVEFSYDLTLSKKVTAGVKKVDFTVTYYDCNGDFKTATLNMFINVKRGAVANGGTEGTSSTPRIIISGYKVDVEQVYAGEPFTVTFDVLNTSSSESVSNIQMKVTDAASAVLPVSGGSNTVYIDKIGKGETHTESLTLQAAADAEAKPYTLNISFAYEGASSKTAYTAEETVTIPVAQRIRLKLNDPVINDEAYVGQSCSMYVVLYNLGKSAISNCVVDVEGDGLVMEESYFGGNISSGGSMNADFNVIPSTAGEIQGNILIIYEDSLGTQYTEKLPFTLYVNEQPVYDDAMMGGEFETEPEKSTGSFPWWVVIAVIAAGGIAVLIIFLKRRRARQIADIENSEDNAL